MKRKEIIGISIVAILIIIIIFSVIFPKTKSISTAPSGNDIVGQLKNGDIIEIEFISKGNYKKVGIPIATYGKVIDKGWIDVTIRNNNKQKKYKVKLGNIIDNEYYYLKYKLKKNNKYQIHMKLNKPKYPITTYVTRQDKKSITKLNGNILNGNIRLSFMSYKKDYSSIWNYIFMVSIVALYIVLVRNSGDINEK